MTQLLPIFPLSNVVLFPRATVPLHIFEPRYRQMTQVALDGDRAIAMVTVRPEHAADMEGDPPIYEIGCAGFIQNHQRLADGRFHLVLQGTHRVRITQEQPTDADRLFRLGEVESLEDPLRDPKGAAELREQILAHLARIVAESGAPAMESAIGRLQSMEIAAFADGICQAVSLPTAEKQGLLEAETIDERLARLEAALGFHLALIGRGGTEDAGPNQVH